MQRVQRRGRRMWRPAVGVLIAATVLAGCGDDERPSGPAQPADQALTGCLERADFDLSRLDGTLIRVTMTDGESAASIIELSSDETASELGLNLEENGAAIDNRVVIYRRGVAPGAKAMIERCMRENPEPNPRNV